MDKEHYMERFRTPIYLPFAVFGPVALSLLVIGVMIGERQLAASFGIVGIGLLSWTLAEYILHRFPFHHPVKKDPWRFLSSGQHMLHHEIPNHADYVAAPLTMSLIIYTVIMGAALLATQSLSATLLWGSGFAMAYLLYEYVHYYAHHGRGAGPLGSYLKRYHLIHHFKDSHNYFGVTTPFWDWVFGTKPAYDPQADTKILPIASREKV